MEFYVCSEGKGILALLNDETPCMEGLQELHPGMVEAATEKHIPVRIDSQSPGKVKVSVGQVEHPMEAAHWIEWVAVETDQGVCLRRLNPGQPPHAEFALLEGEKPKAVYAYCNLHGLWKTEQA